MPILDLVVVADQSCSTSRTYLTYLKNAGYTVRKILVVDFRYGAASSPMTRPSFFEPIRERLFGRSKEVVITVPPPVHDPVFLDFCNRIQADVPIRIDYSSPFNYSAHGQSVESLVAHDYNDECLSSKILAEAPSVFLYTNGGIVPKSLLRNSDIRFLHVHPGIVPFVRGSDGLYWSMNQRGRPGASCFYMEPIVDAGSVIETMEFHAPSLRLFDRDSVLENEESFYRAALYALDPHLRAQLFLRVVQNAAGGDLSTLKARSQTGESRTFYWMHPILRGRVAADMIARGQEFPPSLIKPWTDECAHN